MVTITKKHRVLHELKNKLDFEYPDDDEHFIVHDHEMISYAIYGIDYHLQITELDQLEFELVQMDLFYNQKGGD